MRATSLAVVMFWSMICWPLATAIGNGTSCTFSTRFFAVTTTSERRVWGGAPASVATSAAGVAVSGADAAPPGGDEGAGLGAGAAVGGGGGTGPGGFDDEAFDVDGFAAEGPLASGALGVGVDASGAASGGGTAASGFPAGGGAAWARADAVRPSSNAPTTAPAMAPRLLAPPRPHAAPHPPPRSSPVSFRFSVLRAVPWLIFTNPSIWLARLPHGAVSSRPCAKREPRDIRNSDCESIGEIGHQ